MKIAVTKATLQVPPTYFAVQHAIMLSDRFDFGFFASAVDMGDLAVPARLSITDVSQTIPILGTRPYPIRERVAPLMTIPTSRAISRWKPDLIHQHFANLSGAAVRAHDHTGAPLILTVHGADVYLPLLSVTGRTFIARRLLSHHQRTVRRAFEEATVILAVSEYLAGRAVAAGADARKVKVHYQGIDTDVYTPGDDDGAQQEPRVVFVGALSAAKGVPDLLKASIRLATTTPHRLVLAGDGPLRAMVAAAAEDHPHIEILGSVDRTRIKQVLDGARVLVLPTQERSGWREAAGLVTVEAQSMRVPVVVYNSGGASEMFDDGRTGVLVPECDVDALQDAIRLIVEMPATEHTAMGRRSREYVVKHRSLAVSADELAGYYEEVKR